MERNFGQGWIIQVACLYLIQMILNIFRRLHLDDVIDKVDAAIVKTLGNAGMW